jgi:hypothetical protein
MPRSRTLITVQIILAVYSGFTFSPSCTFSQPTPSAQTSNPFEVFFNSLAAMQGSGGGSGETGYIKLMDSVGAMAPAEIAAGIPIIDQQIDNKVEPQNRLAKFDAANLLVVISQRPDGPELLAPQINRLASMLNDPSHLLSGPALMTLKGIGRSRPDVVWPILEAALKAPEVNNATGLGPGIAITLLRTGPHGDDVTEHVAQYMRRSDLTDNQLLATIIGINNSPIIPDALTTELVRCLDRPNEHIKSRALVGIARSSPSAMGAIRMRVQKMANDPRETPHIRRIAAEALQGEITENPDIDK